MDGHRQVFEAITDIWHLWKKYGSCRLDDRKWEALIQEGQQMHKKHEAVDPEVDLFFRDMFMALQKYYERKEPGHEKENHHQR